jgi:hypothetical protein
MNYHSTPIAIAPPQRRTSKPADDLSNSSTAFDAR